MFIGYSANHITYVNDTFLNYSRDAKNICFFLRSNMFYIKVELVCINAKYLLAIY